MLATRDDAIREWIYVVGAERPGQAWFSHDWDVWVANPYYVGPEVPHPECGEPMSSEAIAWEIYAARCHAAGI